MKRNHPEVYLRYGIPEYRLLDAVVDSEVKRIAELSVVFHLGEPMGLADRNIIPAEKLNHDCEIYPAIDLDKCVGCLLCSYVCPVGATAKGELEFKKDRSKSRKSEGIIR